MFRDGENAIVVVPGGNATRAIEDEQRAAVADGDVILAQLKVRQDVLVAAVSARRSGRCSSSTLHQAHP